MSREDFEAAIDAGENGRSLDAWTNVCLEALRIAADQMTEREKVVAWLRSYKPGPSMKIETAASILATKIERGDHSSAKPASGWRTMETAPRDGTRILIWFLHDNAKYADDPIKDGWAAAHEAYWTDHNGGGWTWYGLSGVATYWQPLPSPPGEGR